MTSRPLKIMAMDPEGLNIISAHVQDAVTTIGELRYMPRHQQFAVALNRFAWEQAEKSQNKELERHRAVLHFDRVNSAKINGIDLKQNDVVLSVLALLFHPGKEPGGHVEIVLSGDGGILLEVECIEAQLSDLGAAWATQNRPDHEHGR